MCTSPHERGFGIASNPNGAEAVLQAGADVIVKLSSQNFPLYSDHKKRLNLLRLLNGWFGQDASASPLTAPVIFKDRQIWFHAKCINETSPAGLRLFTDYLCALTTVPSDSLAADDVFALCHHYNELEPIFRKLDKSVQKTKRKPIGENESTSAWMQAKLLFELLSEGLPSRRKARRRRLASTAIDKPVHSRSSNDRQRRRLTDTEIAEAEMGLQYEMINAALDVKIGVTMSMRKVRRRLNCILREMPQEEQNVVPDMIWRFLNALGVKGSESVCHHLKLVEPSAIGCFRYQGRVAKECQSCSLATAAVGPAICPLVYQKEK